MGLVNRARGGSDVVWRLRCRRGKQMQNGGHSRPNLLGAEKPVQRSLSQKACARTRTNLTA